MKANGTLTLRYFEKGGTAEIIFDWDGGPVIEVTMESFIRHKQYLYRHDVEDLLFEGLFKIPKGYNEPGKIGQFKVICIGRANEFTEWSQFLARTDTIAGRLAITAARIGDTGRAFKRCILRILRTWNLAKFQPGEVISWHTINAVRWVRERIGHG